MKIGMNDEVLTEAQAAAVQETKETENTKAEGEGKTGEKTQPPAAVAQQRVDPRPRIAPKQYPEKPKNKKGFRFWWIPVVVLIILIPTIMATVLKDQIAKLTGKIGTAVTVEEATTGSLSQTVEISGTVQTEESKTYFAPVSAKVLSCDIKQGDIVKSGEKFVEFDVDDLKEQLEKAKLEQQVSLIGSDIAITQVNSGQAKVAEAAAELPEYEAYVAHYQEAVGQISSQLAEAGKLQKEQAAITAEIQEYAKILKSDPENKKALKKTEQKQEELKEVAKKLKAYDVDALQAAYETCSADLAEYKAMKEKAEAVKDTADPTAGLQKKQQAVSKEIAERSTDDLEEMIAIAEQGMTCDMDGVVIAAAPQAGMTVSEGMELFSVQSTKKVKVVIPAGKNDLEKLSEGQEATIKIGENEYQGKVAKISRVAATNAQGSVTVDVDVHIDNPDDSIILGTEGKVTVQTADKKDIVLIPMVCLNYSSDSTFVYVVRDGKLEKAVVETGISDDEMIEIVSGVSAGDQIVKNVTSDMKEGMDVMPVSKDESEDAEEKDKK